MEPYDRVEKLFKVVPETGVLSLGELQNDPSYDERLYNILVNEGSFIETIHLDSGKKDVSRRSHRPGKLF